jgi:hypothetical protein
MFRFNKNKIKNIEFIFYIDFIIQLSLVVNKLWASLEQYGVLNIESDHIKIQRKKWRPATT